MCLNWECHLVMHLNTINQKRLEMLLLGKFIIIGQAADPNRPPNSTPLNRHYFIVTLNFQRHRVSLEVEVENTFKSLPCLVLGLHHNLSCSVPSATSFLLQFIFFETWGAHMKAVQWPLCPMRLKWSEEVGKEMWTWKPPKFRYGEALLWSKDASISCEV